MGKKIFRGGGVAFFDGLLWGNYGNFPVILRFPGNKCTARKQGVTTHTDRGTVNGRTCLKGKQIA